MRLEEAQRLYAEMKKCNACVMRKGCQQVVTHDGFLDDTPLLLIVGEAPGVDEDTQGIPFVGDCGQLLREALRATKSLNKNNTIISNTLKCRPIGNKFPKVKEIPRLCVATWLDKEIELIEPKRMLLLGNVPLQYVAGFTGITRARGKWLTIKGIRTMATYHPSFVLRRMGAGDLQERQDFFDDIMLVAKEVERLQNVMIEQREAREKMDRKVP